MTDLRIFDGHNDLLSQLWAAKDFHGDSFVAGRDGHLDLAKCRTGGLSGGFFAVWAGNDPANSPDPMAIRREFVAIDPARARRETEGQIALLQAMTRAHPEAIRQCTNAVEIEAAQAAGAIAAVLHIEGAEGIGPDLSELGIWHAEGLRSLGPVWSRPNIFGHGVPFDHPASPDTGPGLTDLGMNLVKECGRLGIMVDLAHLNEAGFWDVAKISDQPLVATHSNAHSVTRCTRNLTDRQLDAMAERGGLVGLNFGCQFLRPDGIKRADTPLEDMIRHLDHLLARMGEHGVALGSDFDGALMPDSLRDAAGLPKLVAAMEEAGYGVALIQRILWGNWLDLIRRVIH